MVVGPAALAVLLSVGVTVTDAATASCRVPGDISAISSSPLVGSYAMIGVPAEMPALKAVSSTELVPPAPPPAATLT
jgi:hypothetical protein